MKCLHFILLCSVHCWALEYSIQTTWNDKQVDHDPVNITLKAFDDVSFKMSVRAPFFNDPPNPGGQVGQPFFGLWEFEVVELFLLNDKNQYVEIEVCPWGQHIVLLLNGKHNAIRHSLPLNFTVQKRSNNYWEGEAHIPTAYLPAKVTKMNAFAIHGSGAERVYEALYPVPAANVTQQTKPDFHRLELFQPIDISQLVTDTSESKLWAESLKE